MEEHRGRAVEVREGDIYAGHVGANSVGSLSQEREKVFVKESESIPARNYFWVIVHAHVYIRTHTYFWVIIQAHVYTHTSG